MKPFTFIGKKNFLYISIFISKETPLLKKENSQRKNILVIKKDLIKVKTFLYLYLQYMKRDVLVMALRYPKGKLLLFPYICTDQIILIYLSRSQNFCEIPTFESALTEIVKCDHSNVVKVWLCRSLYYR